MKSMLTEVDAEVVGPCRHFAEVRRILQLPNTEATRHPPQNGQVASVAAVVAI